MTIPHNAHGTGPSRRFLVVMPTRGAIDNFARILDKHDLLRLRPLWTRRGVSGISPYLTPRLPVLGLIAYAGARILPPFYDESFRFGMYPLYDRWLYSQLKPGDCMLTSYSYANNSMDWCHRHGGKTFLDSGNSHPAHFWSVLEEEHHRWNCRYPPVARFYNERARRTVELSDYVLSPSSFVRNSFLEQGFRPEQILDIFYSVDLSCFSPPRQERPPQRPLTLVNTGMLNLRKGTPYLLEAFRLLRKDVPNARLLLNNTISDSVKPILRQYRDLPIEWSPNLPHDKLAERLRSADLFILPSLEEGLVMTALEAIACGRPVILTPNTGANDYVTEGVNGSIVPIRSAAAIRDAALFWWDKIRAGYHTPTTDLPQRLSFERLESVLVEHLHRLGFLPKN